MDLTNYLVAVGTSMSRVENSQSIGIAIAEKVLDAQDDQAMALLDLMDSGPSFGHMMDIRV